MRFDGRDAGGRNADLIITNGQVLTINSEMDVIEDGIGSIENDQIIAVGNEDLMTRVPC
ncbi:hypothetical protein O9929_15175 [Vibrio lentus]|nr:hypothetical protein [Vibrio lentus]